MQFFSVFGGFLFSFCIYLFRLPNPGSEGKAGSGRVGRVGSVGSVGRFMIGSGASLVVALGFNED